MVPVVEVALRALCPPAWANGSLVANEVCCAGGGQWGGKLYDRVAVAPSDPSGIE